MSKIAINETTFSVQSTLTMSDLNTLKAKAPDALKLFKPGKDGKETDEVMFAISPSASQNMSAYGICFAKAAFGTGKAIYVENLPDDLESVDKAKEFVAERVGFAKKHLDAIEAHAAAALTQLKADHDEIIAGIEVSAPTESEAADTAAV